MKKRKKLKEHKIVKKALKNKVLITILSIIFVFILLNYFLKGFVYYLVNNDLDNVMYFIYSFKGWSFFVFIALIIFEVIIAPVPGLILNVVGGWMFGPLVGSILVLIGNIIGASLCYLIGKYIGGNYFKKLLQRSRFRRYNKYIKKDGPYVLFILRLNPLTSTDIFSYISGVVNMKFRSFILSTTLGLLPTVFILSYFGDYFINRSLVFRLIFFIVTVLYFSIFFYGIYKIGKNGIQERLKKNKSG